MTTEPQISDHEYEQACVTFRHYSALRYAILTVFIALNAALIPAVHGRDALLGADTGWQGWALRLFGLGAAASFGWIEFVLDAYLTNFSGFLQQARPGSHWVTRSPRYRQSIKAATLFVHVASALFWLMSIGVLLA